MVLNEKFLTELQKRLKVGNRRGVHLNAIPGNSRYKFDLSRLSQIDADLPQRFVDSLLSQQPLKFRISWKDNVPDLNSLFEEEQIQLVRITKAFENLINQTEAIEAEKGINTFGFGFPILARRDRTDNKLTVAPVLIWSLRIKRTKEFNTWEVLRNEDDPIYINEVLINHLQSDANVEIEQISNEMLDDGLISKNELIQVCWQIIKTINPSPPPDLKAIFSKKLDQISPIGDKQHYEKLPLNPTNSLIEFGGLFSIFEVQKQNIINDYNRLLDLNGLTISLDDLTNNNFQPITSVETDPSQQGILNSLDQTRNLLIQGPPGTGKSQTLTAILTNALENSKKTIVVCEKRTALEVLHRALIDRGLNYHCILIKDIVKDRRTVVDSVRDRIDHSEYRRYSYQYSKQSLDEIIEKAADLIANINSKHRKLDVKRLGNKSWTDIVGTLLAKLRNSGDDKRLKNKFSNVQFEYSSEELNKILLSVKEGQKRYNDFKPIEANAFINPDKLRGDNPYVIEDKLKKDFEYYDAQTQYLRRLRGQVQSEYKAMRERELLEQINEISTKIELIYGYEKEFSKIIATSKDEFHKTRKDELATQIQRVSKIADTLLEKDNEFKSLLSESKNQYFEHRNNVLSNQTSKIQHVVAAVTKIIDLNSQNQDFLNDERVASFGYKTLSLFSSKKQKTIADYLTAQQLFADLKSIIDDCHDIDFSFEATTIQQKTLLLGKLKQTIEETRLSFGASIEREFLDFQLDHVTHLTQYHLLPIRKAITLAPPETQKVLESIASGFHLLITTVNDLSASLQDSLEHSRDLPGEFSLQGSYKEIRSAIFELKSQIKEIDRSFDHRIATEFSSLRFEEIPTKAQNHLAQVQKEIASASTDVTNVLQRICLTIENHFTRTKNAFYQLGITLANSKDIKLRYKFYQSIADNTAALPEIEKIIKDIHENFGQKASNEFEHINLLKQDSEEIGLKSLRKLQKDTSALVQKFNDDAWLKARLKSSSFQTLINDLNSYISAQTKYFDSDSDLFTIEFRWHQYYNELSDVQRTIIDGLKSATNWERAFMIIYLDSLLVHQADIQLPMDDHDLDELSSLLNGIEKEQLKFIKEYWYSKQSDATKHFQENNYGLSVENLYNKRSSHQHKRLSLRQIVQHDADLFTTFFPIILTSPDVASNLFKGMNGYFDIVMFDEASQLRLEDNLPAILKGKQVIIAGDEHQMPPSNYFSKIFDGDVEDEDDLEEEDNIKVDKDNILLSCESLLEFGAELNFDKKHLDFHYRSRHPFLIEFSNYAFYNQRLKPLPTNFDYTPIKYIQVNGTFSDHVNETEAKMVLAIIENNIQRLPSGKYPTLGIATFNIAQRNLIKSKILERQKFSKYAEFNAKVSELEENGMFVKNLENIQGDERDVIILSTTYGKGKEGQFAQRFGPINYAKGYKLLNVIITRAKYKVYCITSVPESSFMDYKNYLVTEGSNNKRGAFYAYLAYCKSVSESDHQARLSVLTTLAENTTKSVSLSLRDLGKLESPFEEEVYQVLIDRFGEEKVTPQMEFGGFRIDIVYDPQLPNVPKVAIECDGAKYHSSQEAYLHDLHRQKILEKHGFVFHRIWSTNWWRNQKREAQKLFDFIKNIEEAHYPALEDRSKVGLAFTDDIKKVEEYVVQNLFTERRRKEEAEVITAIQSPQHDGDNESISQRIKADSKVVVKYLNNGKDLKVRLVPNQNNKPAAKNDYQDLYHKSPLALSLQGRSVGDIVKIGNLDNFVEVIEIA